MDNREWFADVDWERCLFFKVGQRGMEDARIPPGASVLVDPQGEIEDGDVVLLELFGVTKLAWVKRNGRNWKFIFSKKPGDGVRCSQKDFYNGDLRIIGKVVSYITKPKSGSRYEEQSQGNKRGEKA